MSKWFEHILMLITALLVALCCASCGSDSVDDLYSHALRSLDGGSYQQALEQLDRAVQETPKERALDLVSRIANDTKHYFERHDYQAEVCLYSAALDAARKAWDDSADDSKLGPLYDQLIDAQISDGEYREAEDTLARSLHKTRGSVSELPTANSPSNIVTLARRIVRTGEHLEEQDQHDLARRLYLYALRVSAGDEQSNDLWLLARIHADLGSSLKTSGQAEDGEVELKSARDFASRAQSSANRTGLSGNVDERRARNLLGIDGGSSHKG